MGNQPIKIMEPSQIKAEILAAVSEELDLWLEAQSKITEGYEYETQYMQFARRVNKIMLEKSMGQLPGSRNKKKRIPVLGK
ncbi:MAG: hypothetical protein ACREBA_02515 [Nitrosotalea sp.]